MLLRLTDVAPLKTHKYFRVAVPQALTGQTLVQILHDLLHLEDPNEALHLATLLLHYGYVFSVIEHAIAVKEDNTLYRIQLPYFWPSHARQTDNVEYGKESSVIVINTFKTNSQRLLYMFIDYHFQRFTSTNV